MRATRLRAAGALLAAASALAFGPGVVTDAVATGPLTTGPGGGFVALTPARVLDTRRHLGATAPAPRVTTRVAVLGHGGVPSSGVAGVVINVSVVHPTARGYVTAYPDGGSRPGTSSVNFGEGVDRANLVVVPVGMDGAIDLYNGSAGTFDLVGDVEGYYRAGTASQPGSFTASAPYRLYDSRTDAPLGPGGVAPVGIAGRDGVPTTGGVTALVNITATQTTVAGRLVAYPAGGDAPSTITLTYPDGGGAVSALAVVPVASNGNIVIQNNGTAATELVVDLVGYLRAGTASQSGTVSPIGPRPLVTDASLSVHASRSVPVLGHGGVPSSGVGAALLDVTAVDPMGESYFTVWPAGEARPRTSTALWDGSISTTALVLAKVGSTGDVEIYDGPSPTGLEVDVVGSVRA